MMTSRNGCPRENPRQKAILMSRRTILNPVWILAALMFQLPLCPAAPPVDFQRQVQPILAEHCTLCHGVDAEDRKSGLRLDLRPDAVKGGESEFIRRISSDDPDLRMPPKDHNKPLATEQIATLKQWIFEGANYEAHWAFTPPAQSPLPDVGTQQAIDAFVSARLQKEALKPSVRASTSALCRRIYLDLTGLPPSPAELSAFETEGTTATIDALMNTERFGEKWARHWLDLARYSDTNGYEKDLQREQWSWRDWVIDSINHDMPYDQFLVEQIAGDLLPNPTQQQIIATGFLRNSMINEEGAIVPEQFRMVEMFDRIDCVGKAVLGLTTQCAQCHTHKFDPLTHDEYYGMFAFLNNSYEAQSWVYTPEQLKQVNEIQAKVLTLEDRIRKERPNWESELAQWAAGLQSKQTKWQPLDAVELGTISGLNHPVQLADKSLLMTGHSSADVFMIAAPALHGVTGVQFEALTHRDLPHNGPGRSRIGTWALNELEVLIRKPDAKDFEKQKLVNATADFSQPESKSDDGKKASGPVTYLIDGKDENTWSADRGIGQRNQPSVAVVQFEQPLDFPEGTQMKIVWHMGDMLGCARFSVTTNVSPAAPVVDHAAMLALQVPAERRTREQNDAVFMAWRKSITELKPTSDEIEALLKSTPAASTSILHMAEREPTNPRLTHLLDRGNWDQPLQVVEPHVPAAFHPFPLNAPKNRLGFAEWLVDRRSPLTARVAVNQAWQAIFGTGLVETSEDFGTRAAVPEYREILDWLAVDFMEHNWSRKHLIRTILTSTTYQQSSEETAELLERDPANRLLARGPRFRADSEVVRDIALTAAGLITHEIGGPGIIPPVPQNVLDYNYTYPGYWTPATGPERYRRTVYGFRKRSMPDPVMSNFDAPNGDFSCARRVRSNTPLAALTGLNETIFVEAARALALRILKESPANDTARADYAFLLCTSRQPAEAERNEILSLLKSQRQRLADGWLNPREVTTGDAAKLPELPGESTPQDAAAWTLVARVMLNLDETISKY
jgi:mono/diheme cytochrome c family protein